MNDRINECEWNCDFRMRANCLVQSTLHFGGKGGLAIVVTLFNVQGFLSYLLKAVALLVVVILVLVHTSCVL